MLLDDVPGNGKSVFLASVASCLRREKPEIFSVLSCAFPDRRIDGGHVGALYAVMGLAEATCSSPKPSSATSAMRAPLSPISSASLLRLFALADLTARRGPALRPSILRGAPKSRC
ncbi:hypothetical protein [Sphingobium limneticum]|uniref:hypothetical protein n=1 Tax=Sphingobium limneticum TaxID=1007511 RepID=UPI0013756FA9|nr:hypothetical protein [Sphingobium limneticum]